MDARNPIEVIMATKTIKPRAKKKIKPPQNDDKSKQNDSQSMPKTAKEAEVKRPARRVIRRISDVRNSELKQIADILLIKSALPKTQVDRLEILRKIKVVIR